MRESASRALSAFLAPATRPQRWCGGPGRAGAPTGSPTAGWRGCPCRRRPCAWPPGAARGQGGLGDDLAVGEVARRVACPSCARWSSSGETSRRSSAQERALVPSWPPPPAPHCGLARQQELEGGADAVFEGLARGEPVGHLADQVQLLRGEFRASLREMRPGPLQARLVAGPSPASRLDWIVYAMVPARMCTPLVNSASRRLSGHRSASSRRECCSACAGSATPGDAGDAALQELLRLEISAEVVDRRGVEDTQYHLVESGLLGLILLRNGRILGPSARVLGLLVLPAESCLGRGYEGQPRVGDALAQWACEFAREDV